MKLYIAALISLLLVFSACSDSSQPQEQTLNAISNEVVIVSTQEAQSYSWSQVSGVKVVLIDSQKQSMSFIAPVVTKDTELVFEVLYTVTTVLNTVNIKTEKVKVIVHPLELLTDKNTTIPTDNNTTIPTNPLKSIALSISNNSLNIETNTTLNAIATYEDNTTKDITQEVKWISTDSNAIQISKHQLQAKKETNIILRAKLNTVTSNAVALEIYKEINGHKLPPLPNQVINNSTLLGIDSNSNGVRDDVERKIYAVYKRPIEQAYMMQDAKIYPHILENPIETATSEEFEKEHWDTATCNGYLMSQDIEILKPVDFMENSYFNTKERMRVYIEFNEASSGGVYHIPLPRDDNKENCDFNVTKMLEIE